MTTPSRLKHRLLLLGLAVAFSELTMWLALTAFPWYVAAPLLAALSYFAGYEVEENW